MFAIGARNFEATKLKFGTELGFHPEMVLANFWAGWTPPPGPGRPKSVSGDPCGLNRAFLGNLYKTKVAERPLYSGGGSGQIRCRTSPRGPAASPSARGWSAAIVIGVLPTWDHGHFGHGAPPPGLTAAGIA